MECEMKVKPVKCSFSSDCSKPIWTNLSNAAAVRFPVNPVNSGAQWIKPIERLKYFLRFYCCFYSFFFKLYFYHNLNSNMVFFLVKLRHINNEICYLNFLSKCFLSGCILIKSISMFVSLVYVQVTLLFISYICN